MIKRIGLFVLLGFFAVSICGCVAVVAAGAGGAGTAGWLSGKLTHEVHASYDKTISATRRGLKAMKLDIDKETRAEEITQFRSKYTDGREIWIDVRPVTADSSKIEVRVGAIGDKEAADKILKNILRYL